jgi:hypothetical protein
MLSECYLKPEICEMAALVKSTSKITSTLSVLLELGDNTHWDLIMKQAKKIKAPHAWAETADRQRNQACVVREWELVTLEIDGEECHFLYGTVVSDYKHRWQPGDYVFTSMVMDFNAEAGLVQTRNSLYCLQGDGEEVFPSLEEAAKMRTIGQSLHTIRAIERDIGKIQGPYHD